MDEVEVITVKSRKLRGTKENIETKKLRLVCVSDTHNLHHKLSLPPDFSVSGGMSSTLSFCKFINSLNIYKHKIIIPGNHERFPDVIAGLISSNCQYLRNDSVEIEGINIYGGRFKPSWPPTFRARDLEAQKEWSHIPDEVDILLTHQPPRGYGDVEFLGSSRGSKPLLKRIEEVKPALHLFGHIHEGWGLQKGRGKYVIDSDTHPLYYTTLIGCASKIGNGHVRPPIIVDFEVPV